MSGARGGTIENSTRPLGRRRLPNLLRVQIVLLPFRVETLFSPVSDDFPKQHTLGEFSEPMHERNMNEVTHWPIHTQLNWSHTCGASVRLSVTLH